MEPTGSPYNVFFEFNSYFYFPLWVWVIILYFATALIGLHFSKDRKKYDSPETTPWWWWPPLIFVILAVLIGPVGTLASYEK